jgi:hypothetical protein
VSASHRSLISPLRKRVSIPFACPDVGPVILLPISI